MSIRVQSLTKIYEEQKAVNQISFELKPGEIVGFLGPNGAGKSTTMKMITGYLAPTSGTASVCGFDTQTDTMQVRQRVGYLAEANPLYYDMYVREYLAFTAAIHQLGKESKQRIDEMISITGLGREMHKKLGALSKGYKQRVGLAQAMIHHPEVLILDEPTSGLDPNQIVEIRELIAHAGQKKTVLLSTHIMQEVQAMCSRVIIINRGNIVADDSVESLKSNTSSEALLVSFGCPVNELSLRKLKHVSKMAATGDQSWKLSTTNTEQLRRELMQWALAENLSITSMQDEGQSLEEVFRSLTAGAEA
ncbi:MAG: gliding motility-associated ABC transporter ATP-binding subunit GldA [Bacteroidetes bacterium]|nr:gliding motility-associated ABC transporter ATP-binding subunit GldA [Bacteroidota bacterium]MBS1629980.1 gliding motility-associated ABC transporter ATP-binding subunit GldA [Bacteroidota bacterium]